LGTDALVRDAMNEAGRAVIFTSIILVIGFSTMLFGALTPFINIGIFTAVIMGLALIGDLIVLPALLYIFDNDKNELIDSGVAAT
jgi:Predicted exporters of the RND superfamily